MPSLLLTTGLLPELGTSNSQDSLLPSTAVPATPSPRPSRDRERRDGPVPVAQSEDRDGATRGGSCAAEPGGVGNGSGADGMAQRLQYGREKEMGQEPICSNEPYVFIQALHS